MISVFDKEKLQSLLRDFYCLTKIRIVVYDDQFEEICSYPEQHTPICSMIRSNLQADEACRRCDRTACAVAARQAEPYLYTCHAGLTEAVTALRVDASIVGYLCFGQLFSYDSRADGVRILTDSTKRYGIDSEKLQQICEEMPVISREYILSSARILHAIASLVVLEKMAEVRQEGMAAKLDQYLSSHFTETIRPEMLCERFSLGRTKLYDMIRHSYGCGLNEHIRHLRLERAKKLLLENPGMSVSEVAAECGYSDYNYFISVFSRQVGMPPKKYQLAEK